MIFTKIYEYLLGEELLEEKRIIEELVEEIDYGTDATLQDRLELEDRIDRFYRLEKINMDKIKNNPEIALDFIEQTGKDIYQIDFGKVARSVDVVTMWKIKELIRKNKPDLEGKVGLNLEYNDFSNDYDKPRINNNDKQDNKENQSDDPSEFDRYQKGECSVTGIDKIHRITIPFSVGLSGNAKTIRDSISTAFNKEIFGSNNSSIIFIRRLLRELIYHNSVLGLTITYGDEEYHYEDYIDKHRVMIVTVARWIIEMYRKFDIRIVYNDLGVNINEASLLTKAILETQIAENYTDKSSLAQPEKVWQKIIRNLSINDLVLYPYGGIASNIVNISSSKYEDNITGEKIMRDSKLDVLNYDSFIFARVNSIDNEKKSVELECSLLGRKGFEKSNYTIDYTNEITLKRIRDQIINVNNGIAGDISILFSRDNLAVLNPLIDANEVLDLLHPTDDIRVEICDVNDLSMANNLNILNWEIKESNYLKTFNMLLNKAQK